MRAQAEVSRGFSGTRSLVALFEATAARKGDAVAAKAKRDGRWQDVRWTEVAQRVRAVADGLAALGVKRGDRVAVIGETTPEWILADLAIMSAGAITVPVYHSSRAHEVEYVLDDSGATFVFCDSEAQAAKVRDVRARLPILQGTIRFTGSPQDDFERTLADVERLGSEWGRAHPEAHAARVAAIGPDDPACFIYTSGTTGNPKGVVLTHGNWLYQAWAIAQLDLVNDSDLVLMFLPMAHSFAKAMEAVWVAVGNTIAFVESLEKLVDNAAEVRPTVMPAVPRIFEKAYNAVIAKGYATPGLKGKLFKLAIESFNEWVDARERGQAAQSFGLLLGRKLVFPKLAKALSERFGGRMRLFVSGAAPLSPRIATFFQELGFVILEGYGLTETSAPVSVNRRGKNKIGTVGPPLPGTEVKTAADGEIVVRGPEVMKGYWRNPEATAEVLKDGWFYTGDIGEIDEDGYIRITDRKKDIIVTAGGKNVAPQNLETELKTDPLISQVMVHGDRRRFLSALVTLNEENVRKWAEERKIDLGGGALSEDPRVRARIQQSIDALNAKQASYSSIKKFAILPHDFTQDAGELTPTLKVKRKYCTQKYKHVLDSFYRE